MEEMLPPESVRGLRVLEEAAFKKTVSVNGLVVPKRQCQEVVKALRKASQTLRINGIAPVRNIPENEVHVKTENLTTVFLAYVYGSESHVHNAFGFMGSHSAVNYSIYSTCIR